MIGRSATAAEAIGGGFLPVWTVAALRPDEAGRQVDVAPARAVRVAAEARAGAAARP
jgi:hypothetical protein